MKRRLTKLVLFLLLGAVVNVAVAWACALSTNLVDDHELHIRGWMHERIPTWWVDVYEARGSLRIWSSSVRDRLPPGYELEEYAFPRWSRVNEDPAVSPPSQEREWFEEARGWPFLSMRCCVDSMEPTEELITSPTGWPDSKFTQCIRLDEWPDDFRVWHPSRDMARFKVLPLQPIWPGFTLDTLLYGGLLWLAWSALVAPIRLVRRVLRDRRGHCIECAYDLRGDFSAGCPECGWRREDVS